MFNTDKPIGKISEDKLGRSYFAKQLANAVMKFKTKDNYVISLQGKWGCGKTSVLNMVIEEITKVAEENDNDEKLIIVKFNPWNFTDTNQLLSQFFLTLSNSLKFNSKEKKIYEIGNAIEKYSIALDYSKYVPIIGTELGFISKIFKSIGKSIKDDADSKLNDVTYLKNRVEKELSELDSRIIVIIDDIDRLTNVQIQLMFQLVNSVAGFSNITYLLSYDKDVVVGALGGVQFCDGNEYLEKIVQVPFDIPQLSLSKLHKVLFEQLDEILEIHSGMDFDSARWSSVFNESISPFIKSLRDVNRYINVLSFNYSNVKTEVDFIDMAGISSLNIFATPIYEWIRNNGFTLVGGYNGGGISLNDIKKREEEFLNQFCKVYSENPQRMLNALKSLFPKFANQISYSSDFSTSDEVHQAMRISSESKFDLYFSLSLDSIKISRAEIDNSLFLMDENELLLYYNRLCEHDLFGNYLSEVKMNMSRIPVERIDLFVRTLIHQSVRCTQIENGLFETNASKISIYMISDMLFKIENETIRSNIIKKLLSTSDNFTFDFLLHLLHIIELTHGRIAETERRNNPKLVNSSDLAELEAIFLKRIKECSVLENIFEWKEVRRAFMLWNFIDEISYSEYIKSRLINDLDILRFIQLHTGVWSSSNNDHEYELISQSYEEYLSDEEILSAIYKARQTEEFWKLDERTIKSSAFFEILKETPSQNRMIEVKKINKRLEKWKL